MSTKVYLQGALSRIDGEIAAMEQRLADLRLRREGALAFLEYMAEDDAEPEAPTEQVTATLTGHQDSQMADPLEAVRGKRTGMSDAVYGVLLTSGYPLDAAGIQLRLKAQDRKASMSQVHEALKYLGRRSRAVPAGPRGFWRIPKDSESPTPADPGEATFSGKEGEVAAAS